MKKRMSLLALALVVITVLVLSGCSKDGTKDGGSASTTPTTSTKPEENKPSGKDLVIEYWSTPAYKNVLGDADPNYGDWEQLKVAEFVKENPNVKINFQMIPSDEIEQKVTIALAGNNPPDILLDGLDRRLMKYVKFGKNEPMDDFISENAADFNQDALKQLSKDGVLYGIPTHTSVTLGFINKKLFEDKGLEKLIPENREWTYEEWRDAMKQVSGNGIYGTALYAGNEQGDEMSSLMYLFGSGVDQWNEDSTKIVMDQFPEAPGVLQMLKDMVAEGSIAPGPATLKALDVLEMFKQGKIAYMAWSPAVYSLVENGKKDGSVSQNVETYGIVPIHKEGYSPKIPTGLTGYTVFKQTDNEKREMIKKFMNFMVSAENAQLLAKSINAVPSRTSAAYEYPYADMVDAMKLITKLSPVNMGKASPAYAEVRQQWYPALQAMFLGQKTPEQAIQEYTKKGNEVLAKQK
ncbi:ABC transporter substrate-binding protein [Paenibacillus eucommiae]|uniref:ABC-type glycerol-3-phosphate transport system substrate-binding protein n=1 Tax=Paenibacillus eucommiae TaxID=1355755 RepID=A0ABS4J4D4_9BACL|nr:sugar ABC transporter substrate-binding protein [Paenibacillus eucommiae]MBP1993956.1 ABC-type glycerol-3-phosphate transport system substrate-binding protein [Paenibacillus eucommiae]